MECCGIPETEYDEVGALLDAIGEQNIDPGVAAVEDPLVLAPSVSHSYDCNRRLTCNHVTTVECYTFEFVRVNFESILQRLPS